MTPLLVTSHAHRAPADASAVRASDEVRTRYARDAARYGAPIATARALRAYRRVPVVPERLADRHPAAHHRGLALAQLLREVGVDAARLEAIRRVRPRFVDDPQAAS
ncbi:MAG: hypothetical protein RI554_08360 [Trueperaceae bacterium]|nr:hypothetical protein [Trueperaceae bacterium]